MKAFAVFEYGKIIIETIQCSKKEAIHKYLDGRHLSFWETMKCFGCKVKPINVVLKRIKRKTK